MLTRDFSVEVMYLFVSALLVSAVLFLVELALRASEANETMPPVGYGSYIDNDFERDKSAFNIFKKAFSKEAKDWTKFNLEFRSPTLNFEGGWRTTTDTPKSANHQVHLYGGSTVLCIEVRDSETLSSCIQRELNVFSRGFLVLNRGISGATVAGGLARFIDTEVKSSDIVVVYFGVNDAKLNEYCQRGKGIFSLIPGWVSVLGLFRIRLKIRIAKWIWLETVSLDGERQREVSVHRANEVTQTLDEWESRVKARGATFVAVLQPYIWLKPRSEAEVALSNRVADTTLSVLRIQYEAFHNVSASREYFQTFESSLDRTRETTFTDWAHTNKLGNEIIARRFVREIFASPDV